MKTPLTYYGGKQQLATRIIKLIPEHQIYVEPFLGGGAVFWSKAPASVEVINDINGEIINFYEVLKRDYNALRNKIEISLHSRDLHRKAETIYNNPDMFERLDRAWAVWLLSAQSFGAMLNGSFGYDRSGTTSKSIRNKRDNFSIDYAIRLQQVQIECADALRIIRSRDTPRTFNYCDPPYPGTDQGHYDGYTQEDFEMLLACLEKIEGKFLLSSFRNKALTEFAKKNGWDSVEIYTSKPMSKGRKIEVLTANYQIRENTEDRR